MKQNAGQQSEFYFHGIQIRNGSKYRHHAWFSQAHFQASFIFSLPSDMLVLVEILKAAFTAGFAPGSKHSYQQQSHTVVRYLRKTINLVDHPLKGFQDW